MTYQLVEKRSENLNTFIVTIVADGNDADDVTETMFYTKDHFENIVKELANLRDNYSKGRQLRNYPNEEGFCIPDDGWACPCHTLVKLTVEYVDEDGKIWDVNF